MSLPQWAVQPHAQFAPLHITPEVPHQSRGSVPVPEQDALCNSKMFSVCSGAQRFRFAPSVYSVPFPINPQSGEGSAVARSRERWPMSAVHSRIMIVVALRLSSPLCVWPAAIAIDLNFNHLLAMANLPLLLKSIAFQFLCLCWCLALHMVGVAPM